MTAPRHALVHEHEFEPQHGLPEALPAGERLLWQGAPDWRQLAVRAFHVRKLTIYFSVILALRASVVLGDGGSTLDALRSVLWLAPLAATGIGLMVVLAWLSARATAYTLTDKRVVMRIGIVLTLTFNLPLRRIAAADFSAGPRGTADIALALAGRDRIAWLNLWPHARPWRVTRPEPMLRCVPDAAALARLLTQAWAEANGRAVEPFGAQRPGPAAATPPRRAAAALSTR